MGDGFRFIFTHPVISFVMISMASGMFAVRCFGTLLSIYVRDMLHSNAGLFGDSEYADRRRHDSGHAGGTARRRAQSRRNTW